MTRLDEFSQRERRHFWLWYAFNPVFWAIMLAVVIVGTMMGALLSLFAAWLWLADRFMHKRSYRDAFDAVVDIHAENLRR